MEAIGIQHASHFHRGVDLVQSPHDVYWQFAQDLGPFEVLLLSHLLPREVSFAGFGFTSLETDQARAQLREAVEGVLSCVFQRSLDPPAQLDTAYTGLFVGQLRGLLHDLHLEPCLTQFSPYSSVVDRYTLFRDFLELHMDQLVPLALAAIMYSVRHDFDGPDYPDVQTATRIEMWSRVILMSASYLYRIGQIWHTADDAQLEHDRRALVDAVQLLRSAADGTAAAELSRVREQLVSMQADMQQRSQDLLQQIETLTRYTAALQRRLESAHAQQS
jgi:hypothetical protein